MGAWILCIYERTKEEIQIFSEKKSVLLIKVSICLPLCRLLLDWKPVYVSAAQSVSEIINNRLIDKLPDMFGCECVLEMRGGAQCSDL